MQGGKSEYRRIAVPANRFTPLKEHWNSIYEPIVKHMKLQIRMNLKTKSVELRVRSSAIHFFPTTIQLRFVDD
jgi:RNA-binding protein PNO1